MTDDRRVSRSSRGARPALSGSLVLSAAAVVLCLLVFEAAVRLLDPRSSLWRYPNLATVHRTHNPVTAGQMRYDSVLGHEPVPGSQGVLLGWPASFSSDGLRNHKRATPPAGGPPILALGDSYTEGWAVADDDTWPAHLERRTGWRVLNAGVRGYGIDQMVLRAERLTPLFKPGVVVLAFIDDDINRVALAVRHAVHKPYFVSAGIGLELRNVPVPTTPIVSPYDPLRRILGYSHLVDFVMRRVGADEIWNSDDVHVAIDPDLVACRLMERFAVLVRREGTHGLVVGLRSDFRGLDASRIASMRTRTAEVLSCARKAGLAVLDTHATFPDEAGDRDGAPVLFFDHHYNAQGNAIVASLIASALETMEQ